MKLKRLKELTYGAWARLSVYNGALVQPENFKPEVRRVGDMRYKATWEKAYAQFRVKNILDCFEGCDSLITLHLNPHFGSDEDRELYSLVLDEFLAQPEGPEYIRLGLEQIFGESFDTEDREAARELLGLVGARREAGRGEPDGLPVDLERQLRSAEAE